MDTSNKKKNKNKKKNVYIVRVKYPTKKPFYIIGDQTGNSRVNYYLKHKAQLHNSVRIIATIDIPEGMRDYYCHLELKNLKWIVWDGEADEGDFETREGFYIKKDSGMTEKDLIDAVRKIYTGTIREYEYVLRPYQNNLDNELSCKFKYNNSVLLYALPRTGKSLMGISEAIRLGFRTIVVTTPYAKAEESFRVPIVRGKSIEVDGEVYSLDGWRFYDKDNLKEWDRNPDKCVFFLSFALERQKRIDSKFSKFLKKLEECNPRPRIFSIVDEIHNTSDTTLSENILRELKAELTLHMSGTPYNDLFQGRFNEKNTVKFDLFDAIDAMSDSRNNLDFPKMGVYQPCNISTLLEDYMKKFPNAKNFEYNNYAIAMSSKEAALYSLGKMFSRENDNDAFSQEKKEKIGSKLGKHAFLYIEDNFKTKIDGKITMVNTMNNCLLALKDLVGDRNSYLYGYKVKSADEFKDEESVNCFQEKHKKTIIVSTQKFTTGTTFDRLDTIIILRSISSTELFTQIIYRVMTPFEGKKNVNVLVLDAEIGLNLSAGIIESRRLTSPKDDAEKLFKKLKDFITFKLYNMNFEEFSTMDLLKRVKGTCNKDVFNIDYRGLGRVANLDSFYKGLTDSEKKALLDSKILGTKIEGKIPIYRSDRLPSIPSDTNEEEEEEISSDPKKNESTKGSESHSVSTKKELEKIKTIISNIPKNIFVADLKTYEEVIRFIPKSIEPVKDIYIKFIKENKNTVMLWLADMRMAMKDIDDEDSFFMENFC